MVQKPYRDQSIEKSLEKAWAFLLHSNPLCIMRRTVSNQTWHVIEIEWNRLYPSNGADRFVQLANTDYLMHVLYVLII